MIETTLTTQQAKALFEKEAIPIKAIGREITSVVPAHRIVELFGVDIGQWVEVNSGLLPDTGEVGCLASKTPSSINFIDGELLIFVDINGFFEVVAEHNSRIVSIQTRESDSGKQWSMIWQARRDRLNAIEAEEERKREERRAKRAAARKKKQESEATA